MSAAGKRRRWTIAVCRTCYRLAVWPFCEHRDVEGGADPGAPGGDWFVYVTVTGRVSPSDGAQP